MNHKIDNKDAVVLRPAVRIAADTNHILPASYRWRAILWKHMGLLFLLDAASIVEREALADPQFNRPNGILLNKFPTCFSKTEKFSARFLVKFRRRIERKKISSRTIRAEIELPKNLGRKYFRTGVRSQSLKLTGNTTLALSGSLIDTPGQQLGTYPLHPPLRKAVGWVLVAELLAFYALVVLFNISKLKIRLLWGYEEMG